MRPDPRATAFALALAFAFPGLSRRLAAEPSAAPTYPSAPRQSIVETIGGRPVADPYRWLEEVTAEPAREWIAAEDRLTRSLLDGDASFASARARLESLLSIDSVGAPTARGERLFYLHTPAGESRPSLLVRESFDAAPRVLLAAASLGAGETLRGAWPSHDGRLVAFGVGSPASSWYEVHLLDVAGGRVLHDRVRGLRGALGTPVWRVDDGGFFYGGYPPPAAGAELTTVPSGHRVLFHAVGGSPGADVEVYSRPDRPELTFAPAVTLDGRHLVVHASAGAAPANDLHVLALSAEGARLRHTLAARGDEVLRYLAGDGDRLLLRTTRGAPRGRIVALDLGDPERWRDVLPEREATLYFANVVAERIVAVYVEDARHRVLVFGLDGRFEREVALPDLGTSFSGFLGRPDDRYAFYTFNAVAYPGSASVFRLDPRTGESVPFAAPPLSFSPGDYVTTQVFYSSADGTRVPMYLAHRRDLPRDGRRPVFLYAYGAFGWAATPWFQPQVLAWMERGGIYALANVRGGGEYGEEWYRAGIGRRRQNAVDDYLAAAEWLVGEGYTARGLVVANGGSASGALPAIAVAQRPELFGAAVIDIPVLDMMRYDRFTGGARWRSELGDPGDPEDVPSLLAQSPYHLVKVGTCYPPTLVTAGERDETAFPAHAYKFVAAVQAAQGCEAPALLQVVWGAGHSFGLDAAQTAETLARQLTFLARVLPRGPGAADVHRAGARER